MDQKYWNMVLIIKGCFMAMLMRSVSCTYQVETELRSNLSQGYDRFARPSIPVTVNLFYNIRALKKVDIAEQQMEIMGWMSLFWTDERLRWNATEHGIEALELNWAWRPEFTVGNAATGEASFGMDNDVTRVRVYSSGNVHWNVILIITTMCEVDISNFPFDTQTCDISIMFWGFRMNEITLNKTFEEIQTLSYMVNAEWELVQTIVSDVGAAEMCCPRSDSPVVQFFLTFQRRRPFYVMNLVIPTVLLSFCMVLVFILPTDSGERLGFALTITLAYTVQLSIISQMMPTTSKQVPHIAQYLLTVLIMCSLVTFNVVFNVKLYHMEGAVHGWLKTFYKKVYPVVFFRCRCRKRKIDECKMEDLQKGVCEKQQQPEMTAYDPQTGSEDSEDVTWHEVSILFDRLCLYVYTIAVLGCTGDFFRSVIR